MYTISESGKVETSEPRRCGLVDAVINIINGQDPEDVRGWLDDVCQYGCQSGMVSELIYYTDTQAWYKEHIKDIAALLSEDLPSCGCNIEEMFGDKWDHEDPLVQDTNNQNLLAWYSFERVCQNIRDQI